ncbi:MAG TPA: DivIVA domain-containing protein [Methylomirabilota bacterium]|nr:DivIVA domain-containing protein [Methylomirabilota bacterium]
MRMTPMEIRQQQFDTQLFRGCDVQQVDAYLNQVAGDYEELMKENNLLKEQLALLEDRLHGVEEREQLLKETLVSAQRMSEEMKEGVRREAQLVLREAELQSEKMLEAARAEEAKIKEEVLTLKRARRQVLEGIHSTVERFQRLAAEEFQREPPDPA